MIACDACNSAIK